MWKGRGRGRRGGGGGGGGGEGEQGQCIRKSKHATEITAIRAYGYLGSHTGHLITKPR